MGFDASVISGVVKFIEPEFNLSKLELGWGVASLSLTATFAMMVSGPLSNKYGRKVMLRWAAVLFLLSAILSAAASSFTFLVVARMIGGLGVGAALIIAPMYIAEIAPAKVRGRLVSLNQLNIVLGISAAFFSNYLLLQLASDPPQWLSAVSLPNSQWRWMLGIEALPALIYLLCLLWVPESPRWLLIKGRSVDAFTVMSKTLGAEQAKSEITSIQADLATNSDKQKVPISALFKPSMKLVMFIGISIAVLQQITGINAVFFYAPMIFELSGLSTDAAFMQAILVGLTNIVFTLVAISLIDKIGRKALLSWGVAGIAVCMFSLSYGFANATYTVTEQVLNAPSLATYTQQLTAMANQTFSNEVDLKQAIHSLLPAAEAAKLESQIMAASININQMLVLISILGFVACFAVSLGPVMWVLFSELFPNHIRGLAISFVGLVNSAVSFAVQFVFPWELATFGSTITFMLYGVFAVVGLAIVIKYLPETKGKTLEELAQQLTGSQTQASALCNAK